MKGRMVDCMRSEAGWVVGLVLVGLFVMSVVGLTATETFINKTGRTVIGIKIEFSKSVRITRHDSVFPDQSPSGRAQEFTFNGGSLRNLGRFSITWMPSSGKVTDYEWIEKAQPSQEGQTSTTQQQEEFKLPDPNTPPILYGNDYPDPDEPLHQPKPDEQIWLTDLDGHGDIYDNDSIKINYAPGFDKSQITKIDVYRNGIRMRFLPDKLDLLTNAQMKTFDGNPAEHSPASNHTDHAIMGYEYKLEINSADHVWILTKTVKSGFRWHPREVWAELPANWAYLLKHEPRASIEKTRAFFKTLEREGFTGISFDMSYYMDNPYSNVVKELFSYDDSIIRSYTTTPSRADLETLLGAITEAGLETHVRGYLWINKEYQKEHGFSWSSEIDPTSPQAFFDMNMKLWMDLVPILNKFNVKLMTPFTEMDGIEKYPELIENMYSKISAVFKGEMGFEEATNLMLAGHSPMQGGRTFE
jgi:hypothetical protein